jgi:hypothetical protein
LRDFAELRLAQCFLEIALKTLAIELTGGVVIYDPAQRKSRASAAQHCDAGAIPAEIPGNAAQLRRRAANAKPPSEEKPRAGWLGGW